jgi:hypothetical protein
MTEKSKIYNNLNDLNDVKEVKSADGTMTLSDPGTKVEGGENGGTCVPQDGLSVAFHYADKSDETMGIETGVYKNGNTVKRFKLSDGRTVIARELSGADSIDIDTAISEMEGDRQKNYHYALFHHAIKVDDKQLHIEDFAGMKMKDFNKIKVAVQAINF